MGWSLKHMDVFWWRISRTHLTVSIYHFTCEWWISRWFLLQLSHQPLDTKSTGKQFPLNTAQIVDVSIKKKKTFLSTIKFYPIISNRKRWLILYVGKKNRMNQYNRYSSLKQYEVVAFLPTWSSQTTVVWILSVGIVATQDYCKKDECTWDCKTMKTDVSR